MPTSLQTLLDGFHEPTRRPDNVFRALEDDTVSSEEGSNDWRPSIVESLSRRNDKVIVSSRKEQDDSTYDSSRIQ